MSQKASLLHWPLKYLSGLMIKTKKKSTRQNKMKPLHTHNLEWPNRPNLRKFCKMSVLFLQVWLQFGLFQSLVFLPMITSSWFWLWYGPFIYFTLFLGRNECTLNFTSHPSSLNYIQIFAHATPSYKFIIPSWIRGFGLWAQVKFVRIVWHKLVLTFFTEILA